MRSVEIPSSFSSVMLEGPRDKIYYDGLLSVGLRLSFDN